MIRTIARDETGRPARSLGATSRIRSPGSVRSSQRKTRRSPPNSVINPAVQVSASGRPPRIAIFLASRRSAADTSGLRLWAVTIRASCQPRPSLAKATWTELIPGITSQFSRPKRRITGCARLAIPGSPVARRTTCRPSSRREAMVSRIPATSVPESIRSAGHSGKRSFRRCETMRTSAFAAAASAAGVIQSTAPGPHPTIIIFFFSTAMVSDLPMNRGCVRRGR